MSKKLVDKLPLVFVNMHITVVEPTRIPQAEALRDALHDLVRAHAEQYGVRIKRKHVSAKRGQELWKQYEDRAKVFMLID
jgi:hypothetical protein